MENLPKEVRHELKLIVGIIKSIVPPLKIYLYDPLILSKKTVRNMPVKEYSLLIIAKSEDCKGNESEIISMIENRCLKLKRVLALVHPIDYVNCGLEYKQEFFIDIIEKGVNIYDSKTHTLVPYSRSNPKEKLIQSKLYLKKYFQKSDHFFQLARFSHKLKEKQLTLFLLQQSLEFLYRAVLLTIGGYDPKIHNVVKLNNYTKHLLYKKNQNTSKLLPSSLMAKSLVLLKESYILSRYGSNFSVEKKEVKYCFELVSIVRKLGKFSCKKHVKKLKRLAAISHKPSPAEPSP